MRQVQWDYSQKTLSSPDGHLSLNIPHDREGSFEPLLVKKYQTRMIQLDDQILALYAIRTIFSYPENIRRAIYTTNAIESLNSVIHHTTKKRKIFSFDDSARKVIYLAVQNAAKKWTMPIQNWRLAMNWFMIHFDDRLRDHL